MRSENVIHVFVLYRVKFQSLLTDLRDVVVIQFIIAECNVNVQSEEFSIIQQNAFVDINRLLIVTTKEYHELFQV